MSRRLAAGVLTAMLVAAGPAAAQPDPWAGSWRGTLRTAAAEAETSVTLTLVAENGGYTGVLTGFAVGSEVRLASVEAGETRITLEAATDTSFGPLALVYSLTRGAPGQGGGAALSGGGRVSLGDHGFDVEIELNRARRADIPQPRVEPRIAYFSGTWTFDYTGGEFPPLSVGSRSGRVTFTPLPHAPFVRGLVEGEVFGDPYTETWTIGFDAQVGGVVWQEQPTAGATRLSLGDWTSPIAITFLAAPIEMDGRVYVMRRSMRMTSDTAFSVTDEFSVDGGPYRRLGNGAFIRSN